MMNRVDGDILLSFIILFVGEGVFKLANYPALPLRLYSVGNPIR